MPASGPGSEGPGRAGQRLPGDQLLPGRTFTGPADFNNQLQAWLVVSNRRQHRRLGCRPVDRLEVDLAAMLTLPPVAPVVGWRTSLRLPRDHYVRVASNDYSVAPSAVGRRVEVTADLETVTITCDGRQVGCHVRSWAMHQSITDLAHAFTAQQLRREHLTHRLGQVPPAEAEQVERRQLSDYDAAFGLDEPAAALTNDVEAVA